LNVYENNALKMLRW